MEKRNPPPEALLSVRISAKMGHVRKQQFFGRVPDF